LWVGACPPTPKTTNPKPPIPNPQSPILVIFKFSYIYLFKIMNNDLYTNLILFNY